MTKTGLDNIFCIFFTNWDVCMVTQIFSIAIVNHHKNINRNFAYSQTFVGITMTSGICLMNPTQESTVELF
jgi:hypothetical protein